MEYFRPTKLKEAYRILEKYGEDAIPVAGSSFYMGHREELFDEVEAVVDIKRLGLDYIKIRKGELRLGATTTLATILESEVVKESPFRVLAETVGELNITEVRNVATVGGEICIAGEVDLPTTLLALDAQIVIGSSKGERSVALGDFHLGYLSNDLKPGEMVKEVRVPKLALRTAAAFAKFERTYADLPLVNVAVRVTLDGKGACIDSRVVVGAAVAVPVRSGAAEAVLDGSNLDPGTLAKAAAATSDVRCLGDIRASAELRALWVRCGVEDALRKAAALAKGE
jgi:carbon-monoxide dehydrogenase medium subunit